MARRSQRLIEEEDRRRNAIEVIVIDSDSDGPSAQPPTLPQETAADEAIRSTATSPGKTVTASRASVPSPDSSVEELEVIPPKSSQQACSPNLVSSTTEPATEQRETVAPVAPPTTAAPCGKVLESSKSNTSQPQQPAHSKHLAYTEPLSPVEDQKEESHKSADEETMKQRAKRRRLALERIVGVVKGPQGTICVVKWCGLPNLEKIRFADLKTLFPDQVFDFMCQHIRWKDKKSPLKAKKDKRLTKV